MTMTKDICPVCEQIRNIDIDTREETHIIKNQEVSATIEVSQCRECGNEFVTDEQMTKNLEKFRAAYRNNNHIISPEEIKALRDTYGVSQKALGKILNFGELTINSYEQGVLPSGAHNNLLKLIKDPMIFKQLLLENKDKLTRTQLNKIGNRIQENANRVSLAGIDYSNHVKRLVGVEDEFNGYTRTNLQKTLFTIQLLLYFSQSEIYKMALLKMLFYADFLHCKRQNKAITGWPYARLPFGPVPEDYKKLLLQGEERLLFTSAPDAEDLGEKYSLGSNFSMERIIQAFTNEEVGAIKDVVKKLGNKTATALMELTHEESAWTENEHAQLISYHYASRLKAV